MINEIKEVENSGKKFEIKKGGVSDALEIQGIFYYLVSKSGINLDEEISDSELSLALQLGLDSYSLPVIKKIIIRHCQAPKLTEDSYESLSINIVPSLFMDIYNFHTEEALKKNEP